MPAGAVASAKVLAPVPVPGKRSLFVVESPPKVKTLAQYLGNEYLVLATKGHVRVIPSILGAIAPDNDYAMAFEVPLRQKGNVAVIVRAAHDAGAVYLAMDPDREGEAIAWHLLREMENAGVRYAPSAAASLGADGACDVVRELATAGGASAPKRPVKRSGSAAAEEGADAGVDVWRVSFNSVSKKAVHDALAARRAVDLNLVAAQQAR
ncbi:DNA topoisomerase [Pavlovales sp. CCMP2436]|nr:DNA topoisomerase [Pavlovales sp. CCMP2436]